jgi:RNA polymerase sigma factor (sigma-70 family)
MPNRSSTAITRVSLIHQVRAGESDGKREFAQIYLPLVRRMLRRNGMRDVDEDDVVQSVMLTVLTKIDDYDTARPFRNWLFGIVRRIWLRHGAESRNAKRLLDNHSFLSTFAAPDRAYQDSATLEWQPLEDSEARAMIVDAALRLDLGSLTSVNSHAIRECIINGRTYGEVAFELNRTPESVRSALRRFRTRLTRLLEQEQIPPTEWLKWLQSNG